jgi:hypothetical protein
VNFERLEKIANAVLYEGFLLYPYRRTSVKNQQRWHFGTLEPAAPGKAPMMQTECLIEVSAAGDFTAASVDVKVRFLQEDTERDLVLAACSLGAPPLQHLFSFAPVKGQVEIASLALSERLYRFTVRISNLSELAGPASSMLSTHTLLAVNNGAFVSLLDPPPEHKAAAAACRNLSTWPVLAGDEGEHSLMLSSPIILYDYPQIAPESAGDFFDGTEIDEMLTLRVLTLSDKEKEELRTGDEKGRQILERTEKMAPAELARLHGAIRSLRSSSQLGFRAGDRVRLHPRKKADIFDIALDGKIAVIESVEQDFEDRVHLAVTVEDDPGREFGIARQIAHRFFFAPEEVELL